MCYTWKYPSKKEDEIEPKEFIKLPQLSFTNITGGEPCFEDSEKTIATAWNWHKNHPNGYGRKEY